ncbi:MAG: hypothetical protein ACYCV4_13515 [Dermatophilaceae bacterium]
MRHLTRVLCSTASVLTMAACGSQGSTSTNASQPPVFPLTITRIGGVAGFHDVLVVASDGLVSVTQKGKAQRQCRLTPEAAKRLTTAASQVPWPRITPASTQPSFPDDMVTMVMSPAGGPVRLEDPQVGAAGPVFNELVNDLNGGRSASGMCKPV